MLEKGVIARKEGRFTLEAAIIIPVVIAVIVSLAHLGLILYQVHVVRCTVEHVATRAAETWNSGLEGFIECDLQDGTKALYRRLADNEKRIMEEAVEGFVISEIESNGLLKPASLDVNVRLDNSLLYRKVTVSAQIIYHVPARRVLGFFGIGPAVGISADACSSIKDPAEFIRNTDFAFDVMDEIEEEYPGISDGVDRLYETMNKILSAIKDIFLK